jgi:hypothetical protein
MRDMTEPYETYDDQSDYDWDYDEDRPPRPKILWGRVISLVVFMFLAFLLGQWMGSGGTVSEDEFTALQAENDQLQGEVDDLEADLADAQAALANQEPTDGTTGEEEDPGTNDPPEELEPRTYTVQQGDSLVAILTKKPPTGYGCRIVTNEEGDEVDMVDNVVSANPGLTPNSLNAGQEITLPTIPEGYSC